MAEHNLQSTHTDFYHTEDSSSDSHIVEPNTEHIQISHDGHQADDDDVAVINETLAWIPLEHSKHQFRALTTPVAIPQIEPNSYRSGPMPFSRAYAPDLAHNDVSCIDFVNFIDNLTIAQAPTAPIQALQVAGTGIGFVPHHWAQAASAGIGMAAGVGSAAVSVTRTKMYLKEVNERYFEPRGLKAMILSDEQLRGRIHENRATTTCLLAPLDESSGVITIAERRIKALRRAISPLDFNVPAPIEQTKVLNKLAAKQVQMRIQRTRAKASKEARKHDTSSTEPAHVSPPARQTSAQHVSDNPDPAKQGTEALLHAQQMNPCSVPEQDPKLQGLQSRLHEITLKADRQLLTESKDKKKEKIMRDKAKDTAKIREKINDREAELSQSNDGGAKEGARRSSRKHKDRDHHEKARNKQGEKEAKKAAKLKWIVVDNINADDAAAAAAASQPDAAVAL